MTQEIAEDASSSRMRRWLMPAFLAFGVLFVIAMGVGATRITLFWDDYEFILMQIREPLSSIVMGTNGHSGPLSRIVLRLATHAFGTWYPGYVMLNAALAVAATAMLMAAVRPTMVRREWLLGVAGIVYVTSLGLVSQAYIAICLEWFVGLTFAAGAALAVSRRAPAGVWIGLFVASMISMSGIAAVNACIVAVVYLIHRWPAARTGGARPGRVAAVVIGLVVAGVLAGLAGSTLALINPSDYYRLISEARGPVPLPTDPLGALSTTGYLVGGWLWAPFLVVALTSSTLILTVTIFFAAHPLLFWAAFAAVAVVLGAAVVLVARRRGWVPAIHSFLPLALVLPVVEWALLLSVAREGSPFPVRYQMVWLLPAMLLIALVLAARIPVPGARVVQVVAIALVVATAVVGVVRLPNSLAIGPDGDSPRVEYSGLQRDRMLECVPDQPPPTPVREISPGLSPEDFCTVVDYLRDTSIAGVVFGVEN